MTMNLKMSMDNFMAVDKLCAGHDEQYLSLCCFHMQQAVEIILKYSIELRGLSFPHVHDISKLYRFYIKAGWNELESLEFLAPTLTEWETSSRYDKSFRTTIDQLNAVKPVYTELYDRVMKYTNELEMQKSTNSKTSEMSAF